MAGDLTIVTRLILVFYDSFNLEFMSYAVPPFCVSSNLSLYHPRLHHSLLWSEIIWLCIFN